MNNTEVMRAISQKTGLSEEMCGKIVQAFEENAGLQGINRLRKQEDLPEEMIARIADAAGAGREDCRKALSALADAAAQGIAGRFS